MKVEFKSLNVPCCLQEVWNKLTEKQKLDYFPHGRRRYNSTLDDRAYCPVCHLWIREYNLIVDFPTVCEHLSEIKGP